jgi:hypothetical protein
VTIGPWLSEPKEVRLASMSERNLCRPNIESERPGYPPEYYHLFKHLDELVAAVVELHRSRRVGHVLDGMSE